MLFLLQTLNKQESLNEVQVVQVVGEALRSLHRPMLACLSPRNVTPTLRHRVLRFALGSPQSFSFLSHPASKGRSGQTEFGNSGKEGESRAHGVCKLWQGRGHPIQGLAGLKRAQGTAVHNLLFCFFQLLREATRPRKDQFLTQSASWQAPPILQQVQFW